MNENVKKVIDIIVKVKEGNFEESTLNGSSNIIEDAAMDSLEIVNFLLLLEDEFGVEIDFESFNMNILDSIDTLCDYIKCIRVS